MRWGLNQYEGKEVIPQARIQIQEKLNIEFKIFIMKKLRNRYPHSFDKHLLKNKVRTVKKFSPKIGYSRAGWDGYLHFKLLSY
jgi:hypothetical protein